MIKFIFHVFKFTTPLDRKKNQDVEMQFVIRSGKRQNC